MDALLKSKPRTFLATTVLDKFWDKAESILFLGEWCKPYKNKAIWENLDYETLDSPLIDQDPGVVLSYINRIYSELLPEVSRWLNKIHNTQNSLEYWDIVAGPFLFTHIQVVYDRYHRLKKAYSLYPELNTIGLSKDSFVTPRDTCEYYNSTIFNEFFNLQLMTQIIELNFTPSINTLNHFYSIENKKHIIITQKKLRQLRKRIILWVLWSLVRLRRSNVVVLLSPGDFGNKKLFKLMLASLFKIIPIIPKDSADSDILALAQTCPDLSLRADLLTLSAYDDFSKLVLELLVVNMPMSFVENYKKECEISDKFYPHCAKVVFGLPGITREFPKLWVAKNKKHGAMQIGYQHGGGYGMMSLDSIEWLEHKFSDYYVAWGTQSKGKVVAAPSIIACSLVEEKKNNIKLSFDCNTILWVATEFTTYPSEIKQGLEAHRNELLYHDWHYKVLDLLEPAIFSKIKLRLRYTDWSDYWKYLRDAYPTLNLHKPTHRDTFYDQMCNASLLLFDNLNTTHLYGMAFNIPSILFWDEKIWTIRDEVRLYFDSLKQVGILHTTPESAANMINLVGKDPLPWWNKKEVQFARKQYCDYFIHYSKNWVMEWKKILLGFLDNKKEII